MGGMASPASAQVLTFGANGPSGNYAAFIASLSGYGATANTITFAGQPNGPLNPNFTPGVTLTPSGDVNTIMTSAGPGQGNTSGAVLGEGPHASSEFLFDGVNASSLTISFANPVFGVGLFIIDYFNPGFNNTLNVYAWTGQNGGGSMLAGFSSVSQNFQNNNMYFMGVTSGAGNIGSLVFEDANSNAGDTIGLDNITYGTAANVTATPEPASILLMATGLAGLAMARRKRTTA